MQSDTIPSDHETNNSSCYDIFSELSDIRRKHPNRFLCAHLNINSLRFKFCHITELLQKGTVDILFLSETKLDQSFVDCQFKVDNYTLWRADRTSRGGGIAAYLRSDIAGDRKKNLEFDFIESIGIELILNNKKWFLCGAYKPPSMSDSTFTNDFTKNLDKITCNYDNFMILGDLNFDMLNDEKCVVLKNMCDIFDLTNLVKEPTCFCKDANPSLVDVILTNKPNYCCNICNFETGLSDVHHLVSVQFKGEIPQGHKDKKKKQYRSYKNFDSENFISDLGQLDFCFSEFQDVNEAYENFNSKFMQTYNKHVPLKKRNVVRKPVPFMNRKLRQAVYKKRMLHNVYKAHRDSKSWEQYRMQRNLVNKIKRESVKKYFMERCVGGPKSKDFWPTIKPFLTNKGSNFENNIVLNENDKLLTNQNEISNVFNNFFINVAKDIGNDSIPIDENHPSVQKVKEISQADSDDLVFKPITEDFVEKQINKISKKKRQPVLMKFHQKF